MYKWINAYSAPYNNDVMFSKGFDTKKEAYLSRGVKRKSMTGRYIGAPIRVQLQPSKKLIKKSWIP